MSERATLVLVPTEFEARLLAEAGGFGAGARVELGGFGPVAAAARAAHLLSELRPARVVLLGIAGTYDEGALPVGSALRLGAVAIDGIGAGQGDDLVGPDALGIAQWQGVGERLALSGGGDTLLLTVCAASATAAEAARRRRRFPGVVGEDMEGFAVALACVLSGVELSIVRGASNRVGDREHRKWRSREAIAAARSLALEQGIV